MSSIIQVIELVVIKVQIIHGCRRRDPNLHDVADGRKRSIILAKFNSVKLITHGSNPICKAKCCVFDNLSYLMCAKIINYQAIF